MLKKAPFLSPQPQRAKARLSTDQVAGPLAREAYTRVHEQDKGATRLREIAMAGREHMLACQPKPWRRLADLFNILLN